MKAIKNQTTKPQIGEFVCALWCGSPVQFDKGCFGKVVKVGRTNVTIEGPTGKKHTASIKEDAVQGFTSNMKEVDAYAAKAQTPWNHKQFIF